MKTELLSLLVMKMVLDIGMFVLLVENELRMGIIIITIMMERIMRNSGDLMVRFILMMKMIRSLKMARKADNKGLSATAKAKSDEFYTQYQDIQKEINAYLEYDPNVFRGKTVDKE